MSGGLLRWWHYRRRLTIGPSSDRYPWPIELVRHLHHDGTQPDQLRIQGGEARMPKPKHIVCSRYSHYVRCGLHFLHNRDGPIE